MNKKRSNARRSLSALLAAFIVFSLVIGMIYVATPAAGDTAYAAGTAWIYFYCLDYYGNPIPDMTFTARVGTYYLRDSYPNGNEGSIAIFTSDSNGLVSIPRLLTDLTFTVELTKAWLDSHNENSYVFGMSPYGGYTNPGRDDPIVTIEANTMWTFDYNHTPAWVYWGDGSGGQSIPLKEIHDLFELSKHADTKLKPDLTLKKSVVEVNDSTSFGKDSVSGLPLVKAGDKVTYQFTVLNIGDLRAKFTLTDVLPEGLSFNQTSNPGWTMEADGTLKYVSSGYAAPAAKGNATGTSLPAVPVIVELNLTLASIPAGSNGLIKNIATVTWDGGIDEDEADVTVVGTEDPPKLGSLELNKLVTGDNADETKLFDFTISFDGKNDLSGIKLNGNAFTSGGTVKLSHNMTALLTDIPAKTTFTITESDYADAYYTATYKIGGDAGVNGRTATGSIADKAIAAVTFTNDYSAPPTNTPPGGTTETPTGETTQPPPSSPSTTPSSPEPSQTPSNPSTTPSSSTEPSPSPSQTPDPSSEPSPTPDDDADEPSPDVDEPEYGDDEPGYYPDEPEPEPEPSSYQEPETPRPQIEFRDGTNPEDFPDIDFNKLQPDPTTPGGTDRGAPPVPVDFSDTLIPLYNEFDELYFIEFDGDIPLGEWHYSDVEEMWLFEEYDPPLAELEVVSAMPYTGASNLAALWLAGLCVSLAAYIAISRKISRKAR